MNGSKDGNFGGGTEKSAYKTDAVNDKIDIILEEIDQ